MLAKFKSDFLKGCLKEIHRGFFFFLKNLCKFKITFQKESLEKHSREEKKNFVSFVADLASS